MQDFSLEVNGNIITGLQWGDPSKPVLLALHGWLDNAASFIPLANALADPLADGSLPYQLIALDLPGHGNSYHKQDHYHFIDWIEDLYQIIEKANWAPLSIIGHSMGAMVTSIFAATFPELVNKILLIEGVGAMSSKPEQTVTLLRKGIESRSQNYDRTFGMKSDKISNKKSIKYCNQKNNKSMTLEKVVQARCFVSDLNRAEAVLICNRNLIQTSEGLEWRSDPKLKSASLTRFTEPQVADILSFISASCGIVIGNKGYPLISDILSHDIFCKPHFQKFRLPGGHHVHMENALGTADILVKFINQ
jgi:pimeloyl-ACP methyl ester carboxylesterase